MPIEFELRGFVHKKSFNALSQYYVDCYFDSLVQRKDEIQTKVVEFFEQVKDQINLGTYFPFCLY